MDAQDRVTDLSVGDAAGTISATIDDPTDRRVQPRYDVDSECTLSLVSHGLSLPCHILDLSLEGCRLRIQEHYALGSGMRVEAAFKVNGIAFRFVGVIRWTDGRNLAGIHFVEILSRRSEQLAEVIVEIERAAATRAAKEAALRAAAEAETEEESKRQAEEEVRQREQQMLDDLTAREALDSAERQAREWAEIQEIARRAKAARERAAQLERQSAEIRDRRARERLKVDSTATVLLVRCGSTIRGHILDLSLSGCRIRSDEKFPVGIYTRVETEFCIEGLPFLLGGVVQAIHDPHTVGIRFLDMSQRKQGQVEQLIHEIDEMRNEPPASQEGAIEAQG